MADIYDSVPPMPEVAATFAAAAAKAEQCGSACYGDSGFGGITRG